MVSSRGISALVCLVVGFGCIASVLRSHGDDSGAVVAVARQFVVPEPDAVRPAPRAVLAAAPPPAAVDAALPTGSIAPNSALHVPNPAAYAGLARAGTPPTVTGAEAINYLAGNTLRREGPGEPLHFTYFAARGVMGEGDERGFTARTWDRNRPELCETGDDGIPLCRSVTILLDGKYEFPGARLGSVTLGSAGGAAAVTAVLVDGNAIHFPDHLPFLDSSVDMAAADAPIASQGAEAPEAKGGDPIDGIVGHAAAVLGEGAASARSVVYYARDNRRFALQSIQVGDDKAVRATVGHWRAAKGTLCETRVIGEAAQTCFKAEHLGRGTLRLAPSGKAGEALTLMVLPETGTRAIAED